MRGGKAGAKSTRRAQPGGAFYHKHSLGQNFIEDETLLEQLADLAMVSQEDCVLEIGPGLGTLTRPLARRCSRLVALEIDRTLLPILRVTLEHTPNASVICGDVMKTDLASLVQERFGACPLRVAANLPYYITTDVLVKLMRELPQARSIAVMVQKEVGDKLLSQPGEDGYGPLAILCQYHFWVRRALDVPAACFTPPPKVDSSFMVLERREEPLCPVADEALFAQVVRGAFAMRRKMLVNNLMASSGLQREKALDCMQRAGIPQKARAEALSIEKLASLANEIANMQNM